MSQATRSRRDRAQTVSRRDALIAGAAGLVGAAAAPLAGQSADQAARARVPADPTKVQGSNATNLGTRSPFERPVRTSMGRAARRARRRSRI